MSVIFRRFEDKDSTTSSGNGYITYNSIKQYLSKNQRKPGRVSVHDTRLSEKDLLNIFSQNGTFTGENSKNVRLDFNGFFNCKVFFKLICKTHLTC